MLTIGTIAIATGEIDAAEDCGHLLVLDQLARGDLALRRVRLVVALDQHQRLAEHATFRVDLVDGNLETAGNRLA